MSETFRSTTIDRRTGVGWLFLVLAIGCATHALYFVHSMINTPDADPGYETDWHFKLLMFAIFRLPFWILGVVLFALSNIADVDP